MSEWIYERSNDNRFRYVLGESGTCPLVCFGVNPSTATPERLDPTLTRVREWARRTDYDGWLMFNLYPERATDPRRLPRVRDGVCCGRNVATIRRVLGQMNTPTIWAAWGNSITMRPYLTECLLEVLEFVPVGLLWVSTGLTTMGHPRHPLYVPYTSRFLPFDIAGYMGSPCLRIPSLRRRRRCRESE